MASRQAVFPSIYTLGGILANLFKGNYLFHNQTAHVNIASN